MKFQKFLMLAGVAALMASCSQDEPLSVPEGGIPAEIAANDSYAILSLSMPNVGGRAVSAEDATVESEYKVANGVLILFEKGETEDDAKYVGRWPIGTSWLDEKEKVDINRKSYVTVAFEKGTFETDKSYSALIALNVNTGTENPFPFPKDGDTFGDWRKTASDMTFIYKANNANYMTMISAPKYLNSSTATVTKTATLVDINPNAIKSDISKLDPNNPAANFYVHRIPAKVTVSADGNTGEDQTYKIGSGAFKDAVVKFENWGVDGVAKKCYPVQNVEGLNLFPAHMHTGATDTDFENFARCSWGKGVFYNGEYAASNYDSKGLKAFSDNRCEYIKENTMDYNFQIEQLTTRVVLEASYSIDGKDPSTIIRLGKVSTTFWTKTNLKAEIQAKTAAVMNVSVDNVTVSENETSFTGGYYSLVNVEGRGGYCTISAKDAKNNAVEISTTDLDQIGRQLGLQGATTKEIALYASGKCYYPIYIRHFADDDVAEGADYVKLGDLEIKNADDYKPKHLGRYGVLRNNWYEVNIQSVSKIGEPSIPEPTDEPDDKVKDEVQALNFNIYMLNWAKRTQNEQL